MSPCNAPTSMLESNYPTNRRPLTTTVLSMHTQTKLYEGKAKVLFADRDESTLIQYFKDDTTAFNGKKHAVIDGKGIVNNHISAKLFATLGTAGIPHHFIARLDDRQQRIRHCQIIPIEVVVRNVVAGSLTRLMTKGTPLTPPLLEYYLKDDTLGDPLINKAHIRVLGLADDAEMNTIEEVALATNTHLTQLFASIDLVLVDFKLEFGRPKHPKPHEATLMIADEISPDSCRLWDATTGEVKDKDRFRHDLGDLMTGYQDIADRLDGIKTETKTKPRQPACV